MIPHDGDANSEARNLYVSGRVPTTVKGPVRGGTNINILLGADAFYSQGFTGANAVIANIESGRRRRRRRRRLPTVAARLGHDRLWRHEKHEDADGDMDVDDADLALWKAVYGQLAAAAAGASTLEPAAAVLFLIAATLMARRSLWIACMRHTCRLTKRSSERRRAAAVSVRANRGPLAEVRSLDHFARSTNDQ